MTRGALGGRGVWTLDSAHCLLEWSPGTPGSRCGFPLSVWGARSHTHTRTATQTTQGCPALPSPITLRQFLSAICAGPSLRSHQNSSKTSQDGSPRWRCYDSRGRGGCWEMRRAVVRGVWQATRRLRGSRSNHLATPTPPLLWDGMQQAAPPPSARRSGWWRLGIWSLSSGSARKAGNSWGGGVPPHFSCCLSVSAPLG